MKRSTEKISIKYYEEISKPTDPEGQQVITNALPLDQLHPFEHHPFMTSRPVKGNCLDVLIRHLLSDLLSSHTADLLDCFPDYLAWP